MSWHGYIFIENLALNNAQRGQLVTALRALGNQSGPHPNLLTQYRPRLDNQAAIIEAEFADGDLTVPQVKAYLANIFGTNPATIDHAPLLSQYGNGITLSRGGTDYLRIGEFGGLGSTWEESRQSAVAYLSAFSALWDEQAEVEESPEAQPEIVVPAPAPAIEWVGFEPVKELEAIRDTSPPREAPVLDEPEDVDVPIVFGTVEEIGLSIARSTREPEPAPVPTVSIFGREVKVYDPDFKPTAAVLRLVERVRGRNGS